MPRPKENHNVIGTKWIFKNKQDAHGVVIRNKARLVAQGYSQVEGIYTFNEEFAALMTGKFKMSMMGELKFFLGFKVKKEEKESSSTKPNTLKTCSRDSS